MGQPLMQRYARCGGCLAMVAVNGDDRIRRHLPCGTGRLAAPTALGAELPAGQVFPSDVVEVVDRRGIRLRRLPLGWQECFTGRMIGLQPPEVRAPYRVVRVEPRR